MIVKLELHSSEKVIMCSGNNAATCKLLDISLEYDVIFNKRHAATIGELYDGIALIPYSKVTSTHY